MREQEPTREPDSEQAWRRALQEQIELLKAAYGCDLRVPARADGRDAGGAGAAPPLQPAGEAERPGAALGGGEPRPRLSGEADLSGRR